MEYVTQIFSLFSLSARTRRGFGWLLVGLLVLTSILFAVGERWAKSKAASGASVEAQQLAAANALLFDSELEKFRLLPVVLADHPDVTAMLSAGNGSDVVNDRLYRLAQKTTAAAIYVLRPDGTTVAASNYGQRTSFVGQNYAFRPYFKDALKFGSAELFALGTVSGRPGLYLARRVGGEQDPLGVIVVKIEFDPLQKAWEKQAGISMVTDLHDVVIISVRPEWQFRTLRTLNAKERMDIIKSRQFEGATLRRLPFNAANAQVVIRNQTFSLASQHVGLAGGRIFTLVSTDRTIAAARAEARIVVVIMLFALLCLLVWQFRLFEKAANQALVQRELERMVAERTVDLEAANRQLRIESGERAISEERYRQSREELAQANRLGTLGQVTAGVAHEINQPVAAIRLFAENCRAYLDRDRTENVAESLRQIISLTERIATITAELRGFARRKTPAVAAISLREAIEAALLLVRHRLTATKVAIKWDRQAAEIAVKADRIRLEQVFVNLIQNSLDALEPCKSGTIAMTFKLDESSVVVTFADDGPGMPQAVKKKLFTPFSTGKEQGLGLGLAIVRDIMREFGGDIKLLKGRGAIFELKFIKA